MTAVALHQLVGRTVPVWRLGPGPENSQRWLLRPFDRTRFRPVDAAELDAHRADIISGAAHLEPQPAAFSLAEVTDLERRHADEIQALRSQRQAAFGAERDSWQR
jgi:urea carboxylase